jgi:hypothetical protein
MARYSLYCLFIVLFLGGCIEPYAPPGIATDVHSLVVSGFLNSTEKNATIRLSRTIPLSSTEQAPVEAKAIVSIEEENGTVFPLTETAPGNYTIATIPVNPEKRYRLNIRTANNSQYQSDFVPISVSPPIDSVTWQPSNDGVEIRVNTHDDTGKSKYYYWGFAETWEYTSVYYSTIIYKDGEVKDRPLNADIHTCWAAETSQQILIASSDRLNQDIISQKRLIQIPKRSQKLFIHYSVLVKQRSLTRDAYDYWSQLQKTNENLGGLFDPQPGSVVGNIHNVNDMNEPVMGYFSGGTVEEQRLWIEAKNLPGYLRFSQGIGSCEIDTLKPNELERLGPNELLSVLYSMFTITGYTYTNKSCADCRSMGGTTEKPLFWP